MPRSPSPRQSDAEAFSREDRGRLPGRPEGADRREFFKLGAAALVGVAVAQILPGGKPEPRSEAFSASCSVAIHLEPPNGQRKVRR